ncbi:MAG: gamma-glutamyltransferase family protein [Rhodoferax sp.]|nr:gamma-glutamyltransferase family protein [Rhodoferax sp.]
MRQPPPVQSTASKFGMVTSPHLVATQCGVRVLEGGGNAIEAAIATAAALCVTHPHFCGLGGDAFLIIAGANGLIRNVSGMGQAAHKVDGYCGSIPVRGPRSALTTAGTVDALRCAWDISTQMGGKRSWGSLLKPAIALAREGYEVSNSERFWLDFRRAQSHEMPDVFSQFSMDGRVPEVGTVRKQLQLARTLELLADRGPRDFYEGDLAARLAQGLAQAGSPLTASDLARTQARVEEPLRLPYRDGTLIAHQPPTQGITSLQIMGILERFDLQNIPQGSADYYHLLVEAVKQAFLDRDRFVADPEYVDVPVDWLLSAGHLDGQAASIHMQSALPWPQRFKTGDTVFVGAADAQGHAVSLLATVYFDWGSGVMAGDTGVLWHNRGASFSLDPAHPNVLAPGKRPFHTLNPGMYLQGGQPKIIYGTQGADGQPQTLAAILTRMIDYKMDPLQALAQPRFLLGKTFSDTGETLKLEADVPLAVQNELTRRGHVLRKLDAQSPLMGHPGAIVLDADTGLMRGAHDPRSDGRALGVHAMAAEA